MALRPVLPKLAALPAAALLGLAGCRTTSVATQNLDAVLSSSDGFRYQGDTTTVFKDTFAGFVERLTLGLGGTSEEAELDKIPNPTRLGLENLILLGKSRQGPAAWRHSEQVRVFTRFARSAPSQLLRERALLELRTHGRRLRVPTEFTPLGEAEAANAAELLVSLDGLVDATRRLLAEGGETARVDFDAAVAVLEGASYDVQGGSRLLRAIGPFLKGSRLPAAQRERLEELSLAVQRRLVREALAYGTGDPSPVARAAAMVSNIEVFGDPFLVEATLAMVPDRYVPAELLERHRTFAVPQVPADFGEVHLAVCGALRARGLPEPVQGGDVEALQLRGSLLAALRLMAINDLAYPARSRNAAMRALGVLSGGALATLREEEWNRWFEAEADQLGTEIERLEAAASAGAGSGSS